MTVEAGPGRRAQARAVSESLLRGAALRVLNRDGVLAGLRMQDIAEEAGISRGLINYYFESRSALLRSALEHKRRSFADSIRRHRADHGLRRARRLLRIAIADPDYAKVMTLLALDADPGFEPMHWFADQVDDVRAEIAQGRVEDHDVEALLTLLHATVFGWATFRESLARQVGVPVRELDARVEAALLGLLARGWRDQDV